MERRGVISRAEWRWLIMWIAVALIVTSVPYLIGAARSTPDRVFGGMVIAIEDGYSYLAKMNQGAHGAWLFTLPYTSEPHTPTLVYLHYRLLGKAAALFNLPLAAAFHLARLMANALLLLVVYGFVAQYTASRAVRKAAWLIVAFSGGLGWLLLLTGQPNWLGSYPIDLISPEAFTFLSMYAFPHITLAQMFLLLGFKLLWSQPARTFLAGVCWFVMGVLVPLDVGVVYAIVAASVIAISIERRRLAGDEVRRAIGPVLLIAPIVIYGFVMFTFDPILAEWYAQGVMLSPSPLHYVLAYLLVGGLAIIGLRAKPTSERRESRLLAWLVIVPVMAFSPFSFQRRLIEGWQIPLSLFAAIGLVYRVLPAWRRSRVVRRLTQYRRYSGRGLRRWALAALMLGLFATYALLLSEQATRMLAQLPPSFRDGGEIAALDWLSQRATAADVVLSSYETGNFLPTRVGAHVFLGHGPETAYSEQKRVLVKQFYATDTSIESRQAFLRDWSITYVFYGPLEKRLGQIDLLESGILERVYEQGEYQIYRVER